MVNYQLTPRNKPHHCEPPIEPLYLGMLLQCEQCWKCYEVQDIDGELRICEVSYQYLRDHYVG